MIFIFQKKSKIYTLNLDQYKYNFSKSFICQNKKLITKILNIYKKNSNNILYFNTKQLGQFQIIFNNYSKNNSIVILYGINLCVNYQNLKENYLYFKKINKEHNINKNNYYLKNLKCFKNNIIFILDLETNTIIYIIKDEYNNLVGHALDYFKANLQEFDDRIKQIEESDNNE